MSKQDIVRLYPLPKTREQLPQGVRLKEVFLAIESFWINSSIFVMFWGLLCQVEPDIIIDQLSSAEKASLSGPLQTLSAERLGTTRDDIKAALKSRRHDDSMDLHGISTNAYQVIHAILAIMEHLDDKVGSIMANLRTSGVTTGSVDGLSSMSDIINLIEETTD